jgi:CIC family chloride channel protein
MAVHQAFAFVLHWVSNGPSPLLVFLPLVLGALIVAILTQYRTSVVYYRDNQGRIHELIDVEADGLERAIALYYTSEPALESVLLGKEGVAARWELPTISLAIRKFLATTATLASGGSGGLGASVALIGESVAAGLFKPRPYIAPTILRTSNPLRLVWQWWRSRGPDDLQAAQLSGVAAAMSTLLGAPFAAAFFATEVMYRRRPVISKLVYALIASLTAFFLTDFVSGHGVIFDVPSLPAPPLTLHYYGVLVLMGVAISLVGIYFSRLQASFERGFHHQQPNVWRRYLLGFGFTGVIALGADYVSQAGLELVLGPGETMILAALAGELTVRVALIGLGAKLLATLVTVGSGGSAGLLVPSLFFGTMIAAAMAPIFGYAPAALAVPSMTASLVSIVNVPLAAILFVVEVFGEEYMVPALVVLVVSLIFAHETSIYRTQREYDQSREILPGYSVRRVLVPEAWAGKTVVDLRIRNRFDLNVVGLMERHERDGTVHHHVALNPSAYRPLQVGDILVVLGNNEKLDEFEEASRQRPVEPESEEE